MVSLRKWRTRCLVLLLLWSATSIVWSYQEPDPTGLPFYAEGLTIPAADRHEMALDLVALAVNFPEATKDKPKAVARTLALAMAIHPEGAEAGRASRTLANGETPNPIAGKRDPREIVQRLWKTASALEANSIGDDDKALSYYLMSIVGETVARKDPRFARLWRVLESAPGEHFSGWSKVVETRASSGGGGGETGRPRVGGGGGAGRTGTGGLRPGRPESARPGPIRGPESPRNN